MANQIPEDYRTTASFKNASEAERSRLLRYKADCGISDEQMYLLLCQKDIRETPKEKKQAANRPAESMVICCIFFFLAATGTRQNAIMLLSVVMLLFSSFLYLSGTLNVYTSTLKKIRRRLKRLPQVPSYEDWCAQNPDSMP